MPLKQTNELDHKEVSTSDRSPPLRELIGDRDANRRNFQVLKKQITLESGEKVTFSSFHIESMRLFRGSNTRNIGELEDSGYTTVGEGLYLTAEKKAAIGYAFARFRAEWDFAHGELPTVCEVEIRDLNILNLATEEGRLNFMKFFRQELAAAIDQSLSDKEIRSLPHRTWLFHRTCQDAIANIDYAIEKGSILQPAEIIYDYPLGKVAREVLAREGYDGLRAIEGGESGTNPFTKKSFDIGNHETYVIFDSRKVKIIKEEQITE